MTRISLLTLIGLLWLLPARGQSIFDQWSELKSFHGVMSQTFHPAEEGDLAPIKARSGEMAEKAAALLASEAPEAFRTPAIAKAVKKLSKGSKTLDKLVKSQASDERITASLTALHDVFHEIVGLCRDEQAH